MLRMGHIARFGRSTAALLAGRWQIPLAVIALLCCLLTVYHLKPVEHAAPFEELLAQVSDLAEAGRYHDATDSVANLLEMDPPLSRAQRANLHDALASIIYRQELLRRRPIQSNVAMLLEHHQAADRLGRRPDAYAALRAARAYEWQGKLNPAIDGYRTVLDRDPDVDSRRAALQALVRLLDERVAAHEERRGYIEELLAEEGVAPDYLWSALQQAVQEALDQADQERAHALVEQHGQRFRRSDLKGYLDYLWALVFVAEGNHAQAEPYLDLLAAWLDDNPRADLAMDRAGYLPALHQWLRGLIHLNEGRPQAALGRFERAGALQSHGEMALKTTIGRMGALAQLQRHDAARAAARATVAELETDPATLVQALPRLRAKAMSLYDDRRRQADFGGAIEYLRLALDLAPTPGVDDGRYAPSGPETDGRAAVRLDLLERLGRENEAAAGVASDPELRRLHHAAAGEHYERAAELSTLDEPRYATLLWSSAQQYDRAGRTDDARRMLGEFVEGRDADPRHPQALLQLGQGYAADGLLQEAMGWYRTLAERYPKLEEAAQAKLLTADSLIVLGQQHYDQAGALLRDLIEGGDIAPQARVYRDALFALCDLRYQRGRYAEAISRIEDFLDLYPEDVEGYRLRFMLADSYRRSAYALRDESPPGAAQAAAQQESRERFRTAARLFQAYGDEVSDRADKSAAEHLYERLALFYQGDCMYELNEDATLREALATYRQAAARYQGQPATLTAQAQIANIYIRQGKLKEAASAIERARWLLRNIPDSAFEVSDDGMDRAHWDRLLATIAAAHLFEDL